MSLKRPQFILSIALCGAAVLSAAESRGDVVLSSYVTTEFYNYKINHMPDLDQVRGPLPGDGYMYCVPTAAVNLFAYAANHGYDTTSLLGDWDYQNTNYNNTTDAIAVMGALMGTDAEDGTDCCVLNSMVIFGSTNILKYKKKNLTPDYKPGVSSIAKKGCQGWAVSFVYGRYKPEGTVNGSTWYKRKGGHAVTLQRAYRDGSTWLIRYRDPVDDESQNSQSTFKNKRRDPFGVTGYFSNAQGVRTMAGLFWKDGQVRCIDSYYCIKPIYGGFFSSNGIAGGAGTIKFLDPVPFEGSNNASLPEINLPDDTQLLDLHLSFGEEDVALVITKPSSPLSISKLRTLDMVTGDIATLIPAPSGLKKMDVSRHDQIFAVGLGSKTYRLAADGTEINSTTAAANPTDVTVNDADDFVWILSVPDRKIYKSYADFSEFELIMNVPTNVPMSGDGAIVVDPTSGIPYIKTDGSPKFWRIIPPTGAAGPIATAMPLPGVGDIQGLYMGEDGRLYVTDGPSVAGGDATIKVYAVSPRGDWIADVESPMHNQPGGSHFAVLRSTSNDTDAHTGPEWENLLPSETGDDIAPSADCDADFNGDEAVDGADLGLLLGAWGGDSLYDLNQDDTIDGADLGLLLGMWGTCP